MKPAIPKELSLNQVCLSLVKKLGSIGRRNRQAIALSWLQKML